MPTLPEPSPAPVILDTDVASRFVNGLLPLTLAARLAGRQYSPIQMTPEMSLDAAMPSAGAVAGIKMFIQGLSVGISAFCAAPDPAAEILPWRPTLVVNSGLCGEAEFEACQVAGSLPVQRGAGPVGVQPEEVERAGHVDVVEAGFR